MFYYTFVLINNGQCTNRAFSSSSRVDSRWSSQGSSGTLFRIAFTSYCAMASQMSYGRPMVFLVTLLISLTILTTLTMTLLVYQRINQFWIPSSLDKTFDKSKSKSFCQEIQVKIFVIQVQNESVKIDGQCTNRAFSSSSRVDSRWSSQGSSVTLFRIAFTSYCAMASQMSYDRPMAFSVTLLISLTILTTLTMTQCFQNFSKSFFKLMKIVSRVMATSSRNYQFQKAIKLEFIILYDLQVLNKEKLVYKNYSSSSKSISQDYYKFYSSLFYKTVQKFQY
uniref:Transmembrane domain-containing protein n=1 Tax=Spironucleus salmonicida TaxID=348837 RepID=V6LFQ2_9EUKA|eukprot:EST43375.1 Transmembrane domain-containing protein [Spironucleus salmonicida]